HDDPHGLLSSFADFLARQGRRRLKAVITRPAYDPVEAIAVLRTDLSGCIVAIDDLHTCPAADALLRPLVEDPVPAKILVASRVHPTFYERSDVLRGRVVEMTLSGLDEAASEELLRSRGAPIDADALHRVVASPHAHPFALELLAESARAGDLEAALLRVPRTARLEGILAETAAFLGRFEEARAALERIGASGGEVERLRARIHLGRIQNRLGAYKEARGVLEAAAEDAARLNSPEIEGEALRALGAVERKLGDLEPAVRHLVRAAEVLPSGSRERVRTLTDLGAVLIA